MLILQVNLQLIYTFAPHTHTHTQIQTHTRFGALAQLARALDWQSKGQGFDSPTLHKT